VQFDAGGVEDMLAKAVCTSENFVRRHLGESHSPTGSLPSLRQRQSVGLLILAKAMISLSVMYSSNIAPNPRDNGYGSTLVPNSREKK
jgi:hypothetical protein